MESYKLLISGYYGFDNSGDEAVLWSILTALEAEAKALSVRIEPIVLSAAPAETTKRYGVEAIDRMSPSAIMSALRESDGLISGGGSLLQDVTGWKTIPYYVGVMRLAMMLKKPVFIYAQGMGPVQRTFLQRMIRKTLRKCAYISVRDAESARFLQTIGLDRVELDVVGDPVMGISLEGWESKLSNHSETVSNRNRKVIGLSVRKWTDDQRELDAIAEAFVRLAETEEVHIRFLPFHLPDDLEASEYVIHKMQKLAEQRTQMHLPLELSIAEVDNHPASMIEEVAHCDLLVGMRLHSLIYAANRRVPLIGISYDPKVDRFLEQLDSSPAFQTSKPNASKLLEQMQHLFVHGDSWIAERKNNIDRLEQLSYVPAQQILQKLRI